MENRYQGNLMLIFLMITVGVKKEYKILKI